MSHADAAYTPRDCPKFDSCSAPICPLDRYWESRTHVDGEPVCLWLRELAKPGGRAILEGAIPTDMALAIAVQAPAIALQFSEVRKRLERASKTGSRVAAGRELGRVA